MTLRTEFGSLARDLTARELALLKRYGHKGPITPGLKRVMLALLTECDGDAKTASLGLSESELELIAYYLKYPEEQELVLARFPPRTQAAQLKSALLDHYLQRHHGRFKHDTYYTGPRTPARGGATWS